jgi:hypothetical protein
MEGMDKACQWLAAVRWFSPVSSTNKTNPYDITEILLKVVLNTITLTLQSFSIPSYHWVTFKTFEIIIWLSNLLTMSASDEGYSRKASVVHRMIFDFSGQTCIKRSLSGLRNSSHIRQVTSQKRFNSYEIFYDRTRKMWSFNTDNVHVKLLIIYDTG